MVRTFIKGVCKIVSSILFRTKVIGKENLPKEGACILCSNHKSNWDAPVLISNVKRKVYIMAKEELFKNNFIKWLAKKTCVFPVKRGKQDISAMKQSLKVLNDGEILGIFPEGTRNGLAKNGKLQNGVAFLSAKTGIPIVPVGIQGSFKPFRKVIINIGQALDFSEYKTKNPDKEILDKISEEIKEKIVILAGEEKLLEEKNVD